MSDEGSDDEDWFERALGEDDESDRSGSDRDDGSATEGSPFGEPDEADGSPFGDEAGADSGPFGEEESGPFGGTDEDGGPFGEEESSPFDGGDDDSLFEDDFASAMGSVGGGGEEDFSDEGFESAIPRIDLGIQGLDDMIQGGVPERSLIVTIGSAGTGKTTFGLQFLHHGLEQGEQAVFITLEQSREAIMDTAAEFGWEFGEYVDAGQLVVVDMDPVEMANSLDNIRGELPRLIEEFGADRLVLDSVSLLEMMYDNQAKRRTEVFDFTKSLKDAGVTTMLTSEAATEEANEDTAYASRFGIIEYLTDAVVFLRYVRSNTGETRMAVEIQKIRNAKHSRESKPYEITGEGISVYQQASIF